jgi:hypothetical protein
LTQGCQVPKKIKKAKFGHRQFQKRPNSEMGKKARFLKKFTKIYQIKALVYFTGPKFNSPNFEIS